MESETAMAGREREAKTLKRGQITRKKILDCAIELVAETGYANTTTQAILDRSGVSRGSLLHQFPTRQELMVTTGQTALETMIASIETRLRAAAGPLEGMYSYPDILWDVIIEPPALAFYEIQMAARWDAELFAGLKEPVEKVEHYIEGTIRALGRRYEMTDIETYLTEVSIVNDAFPNLAARRSLTSNIERIEGERQKLKDWHSQALSSRLPEKYKTAFQEGGPER